MYSGFEHVESGYIIRSVNAVLVENFEEFVIELNKFSIVDRFILPAVFEIDKIDKKENSEEIYVKFRVFRVDRLLSAIKNKKIKKDDLDDLVRVVLNYLLGVEKGFYPPLGFYSLEDIFCYAGIFFFLPPQVTSNRALKHILKHYSNGNFFYAPEFLNDNVCDFKTTLYVMGKILEFIATTTGAYEEYRDLIESLISRNFLERTTPKKIIENLLLQKELDVNAIDEISRKVLLSVMKDDRKFITVEIPADYHIFNTFSQFLYENVSKFSQNLLKNIYSSNPRQTLKNQVNAFIYVGNDLVNIPRVLLSRYRKYLEHVEEVQILLHSLSRNVKFDTILPVLYSIADRFDNLFLVIDNIADAQHFIRSYVSYLKTNSPSCKVIIITRKAVKDETILDLPNFSEIENLGKRKLEALETAPAQDLPSLLASLSYHARFLAILGKKFTPDELEYLENILNINVENYLRELIRKEFVSLEERGFNFKKSAWEILYGTLPEEKKEIHLKLAKKIEKILDPYRESLSKAAFHYEMGGKELYAAVLYIKFVRINLDKYVFSAEKMKEALTNAYSILKKYDRLNSYSWNSTIVKFVYQTLEKFPNYTLEDILNSLKDVEQSNLNKLNKLNKLISLHAYYLSEKYDKVLEFYKNNFNDSLSKLHSLFNRSNDYNGIENITEDTRQNIQDTAKLESGDEFYMLNAYLIYQRAYYSLNDTLESPNFFRLIADSIPVKNSVWAKLKAEYMILYSMTTSYRNSKEARKYLEKARKIITVQGIKYLEISLENSYGILNDASAISLSHFRKALQIANEIGYIKRTTVPLTNLLRALLYFGFYDELKKEAEKIQYTISALDNLSDAAFFYRILSFITMYEGKYDETFSLLSKSLSLEKTHNLQQASLRSIILNELMNGSWDNAKKLIRDNLDNPAIKTRAFEHLVNLVLSSDNDEKFKEAWFNYKKSPYNLLREEILYIFSEKIVQVDESGFLDEIKRWESSYTIGSVNLSLLYILLAKYKYLKYKSNDIKCTFLENEICKLASSIGNIEHPFLRNCFKKHREEKTKFSLEELIHIFKRLDSNVSIEKFVELFGSEIYRLFKADRVSLSVRDDITSMQYKISNVDKLPSTEVFNLYPLEIFIKEHIDKSASYEIYIYSEHFQTNDIYNFENAITLIEELFSGQLKSLISRERSNVDNLTGLYNRWKFNMLLEHKIEDKSKIFSVFLLDIDDFKKVNDTYGHMVGDKVLKEIARLLQKIVVFENERSENAFVARYGGEEFIGVVDAPKMETLKFCETLRSYLEKESTNLFGFRVTLSIGLAESTEKENLTELIGLADQRLYLAKGSGKNQIKA